MRITDARIHDTLHMMVLHAQLTSIPGGRYSIAAYAAALRSCKAMTPLQLAEYTGLQPQNAYAVLAELHRRKYAERFTARDSSAPHYELTPRGRGAARMAPKSKLIREWYEKLIREWYENAKA